MSSKSSPEIDVKQVDNDDNNSTTGEASKKGKPSPIVTVSSFQTDETPTPTKILKMADMELFHDLKDNPFDVHFRKATEAAKQGATTISTSTSQPGNSGTPEDSLNTPQIFCNGEITPQILSVATNNYSSQSSTSRPVILKVNSRMNQVTSNIPVAFVQPVMANFKPIAPSPTFVHPSSSPNTDNAMLLLKFATGETIKLSNLPFEKVKSPQPEHNTINPDTRFKLKRTISNHSSSTPSFVRQSSSQNSQQEVPINENVVTDEKTELKERNRMSAQRSRQKKRQQSQALGKACLNFQKENSDLNKENKILREEIITLKNLLAQHTDCNVTRTNGLKDLILGKLEPHLVINTEVSNESHKIVVDQSSNTMNDIDAVPIVIAEDNQIVNLPVVETRACLTDSTIAFNSLALPSPPQTVPQDLRVNTRLKKTVEIMDDRFSNKSTTPVALKSQPETLTKMHLFPKPSGSTPFLVDINSSTGSSEENYIIQTQNNENNRYKINNSSIEVKQSLARHCQQVASRKNETKERKVNVAKRLKDKLQILKQKMEEDNNFPLKLDQS